MSTVPKLPLFGRKYQLLIKFPPNENGEQTVLTVTDSTWEPEALRITFDVYTAAWQAFWFADISIYNLDEATTAQIIGDNSNTANGIKQGMEVVLYAGYQNNGNYGVIWAGPVFQPMWDRENVVDFKITLHCILDLNIATRNFVARTYGTSAAGISQQDLVAKMAEDAFRKIPVQPGAISKSLPTTPLKRGVTVFGNPEKYMNWIAADNNMQTWIGSHGLNMAGLASDVSISQKDLVVYTPDTGIVGTPVQTQYGVDFRLLLDPRVQAQKPYMQVKIDNTTIRQQKKQIGVLPSLLDQDGQYIVLAVRHIGDTRGQEWYTEVTGITSLNGKAAILQLIGTDISQG